MHRSDERSNSRSILIGYDAGGEPLARAVVDALERGGVHPAVVDGSGVRDYPEIAFAAGASVVEGLHESAILFCGTGLGMSIAANKVRGIRAARCSDVESVETARRNAAANVLAFGTSNVSEARASQLVQEWCRHSFDSERSRPKIARIVEYERGRE